jgi:hypothetical protein
LHEKYFIISTASCRGTKLLVLGLFRSPENQLPRCVFTAAGNDCFLQAKH